MAAFLLSVVLNLLALAFVAYGGIRLAKEEEVLTEPPPPAERMLTILPGEVESGTEAAAVVEAEAVEAEEVKPRAVRTSEDQRGDRPERPAFIGERDTRAASDRSPDSSAAPLPSQAGIEPRHEEEIETTESDYQDGVLEEAPAPVEDAAAESAEPVPPVPEVPPAEVVEERPEPPPAVAPRDRLAEGPNPVEVPVPLVEEPVVEEREEESPPGSKEEVRQEELVEQEPREPQEESKPPAPVKEEPAFRGYQRKTAIRGSISRTGRSSLDVADSPLGRYQAQISRAVEKEWQLNCVRHRDFITPGFLTVRFFVEASGRVKSVQFVGEMETGEVQKGFTLNSIRNAPIPAMPKGLREEYAEEPLELIFNFYF